MQTPITTQEPRRYEPTSEQVARAGRIRRFNRLYVYAPIAVVSLIAVALIVWLLIIALAPTSVAARITLSAMADAVVIFGTVPLMLLCAVVPLLFIIATAQARQRGIAPTRQLQGWLWIADNALGNFGKRLDATARAVARPFIAAHARASYVSALWNRIVKLITRR